MASKYGYMAKIGADTSGLQEAFKNVEANARNITMELRAVNEGLKFDGGNTDLLNQKYELLANAIENTKEKLNQLKSVEEQVNAAAARGDISATEQQRYQREIANTESQLRRYQTELNTTNSRLSAAAEQTEEVQKATDKYSESVNEAGENTITFGDLLKSNIAGDLVADGLREAANAAKEFVSNGIELASSLSEVQNVVDTTFGNNASKIYAWADTAAKNFGMSSLAAQEYTGTLGAMIKSMGLTEDAVVSMSTDLVGLAGDMASFYNLDVSTAFEKIRSGISGETEPLKQLGINMSVANLEAYALSQGIETAYKNMTEAEKATLRYNYLMQQTADAHGDFAKTSDSYANQQRILQLNIDNLAASLGEKLLPSLNNAIATANSELPKVTPVIENIGDIIGNVTSFALENHEAIINMVTAYVAFKGAMKAGAAIETAYNSYKQLTSALQTATTAQETLNVAANANPWVFVGSLVVGAAAAIGTYVAQLDAAIKSEKELKDEADKIIATSQAEANVAEHKAQRYRELYEVYKQTGEATSELKMLAEDLQELAPDTIDLIDEETGAYLALNDSINDVIQSIRLKGIEEAKQNTLQGHYDNMSEYYTKQAEANQKFYDEIADLGIDPEEYAKGIDGIYKKYFDGTAAETEEFTAEWWSFEQYEYALAQKNAALEKYEKKLADEEAAIEQVNQAYDELYEAQVKSAEQDEKSSGSGTTAVYETFAEAKAKSLQQIAKSEKEQSEQELAEFEENLSVKLTELDDNLALRKISEAEYYSQLKKYLDENANTESKAYYEQLSKYEDYIESKNDLAEKERINAIKASWDNVTAMKNRGVIDDEKEYKLKAQIVKKYCNENEDTWDSYYSWLYEYVSKHEEEIAEEQLEAWEESTKELSDTLSESYEDLVNQKEQVKQELLDIDLSETVTNSDGKEIEVLTNLDEEIKKIDKYKNSLDKLKTTGISDSLLEKINEMNYQDGSRQRFIDTLLGLSSDKLQLYYDDWNRLQEKSEDVSQDIISDSREALNKEAVSAVEETFGGMPAVAYSQGVETAQSYMQGIIDSMGGINDLEAISGIFTAAYSGIGKSSSQSSGTGATEKMILASTPITINFDGKTYIETTVQDLIDKGQRTGGNTFKL